MRSALGLGPCQGPRVPYYFEGPKKQPNNYKTYFSLGLPVIIVLLQKSRIPRLLPTNTIRFGCSLYCF